MGNQTAAVARDSGRGGWGTHEWRGLAFLFLLASAVVVLTHPFPEAVNIVRPIRLPILLQAFLAFWSRQFFTLLGTLAPVLLPVGAFLALSPDLWRRHRRIIRRRIAPLAAVAAIWLGALGVLAGVRWADGGVLGNAAWRLLAGAAGDFWGIGLLVVVTGLIVHLGFQPRGVYRWCWARLQRLPPLLDHAMMRLLAAGQAVAAGWRERQRQQAARAATVTTGPRPTQMLNRGRRRLEELLQQHPEIPAADAARLRERLTAVPASDAVVEDLVAGLLEELAPAATPALEPADEECASPPRLLPLRAAQPEGQAGRRGPEPAHPSIARPGPPAAAVPVPSPQPAYEAQTPSNGPRSVAPPAESPVPLDDGLTQSLAETERLADAAGVVPREEIPDRIAARVGRIPAGSVRRDVVARKAVRIALERDIPLTDASLAAIVLRATEQVAAQERLQQEVESAPRDALSRPEDMLYERFYVDYDHLAGMEALKREMLFQLEGFTVYREVITRIGGKALAPTTGILLYGAPGCGKSLFALATAGEFNQRYGYRVLNVGLGAVKALHWSAQLRRLDEIFQLVRRSAPCVVIWDEIEVLVSDPQKTRRKYDAEKAAVFKQQLDGVIKEQLAVVHIATTNYPWLLEGAMLRPGRFGLVQHVPAPDGPARLDLIRHRLADMALDGDVPVDELARWTDGNTAAEILAFLEAAARRVAMDVIASGVHRGVRLDDFAACRDALAARGYAAWLAEARHQLGRDNLEGMREYFRAVLDAQPAASRV